MGDRSSSRDLSRVWKVTQLSPGWLSCGPGQQPSIRSESVTGGETGLYFLVSLQALNRVRVSGSSPILRVASARFTCDTSWLRPCRAPHTKDE